MQELVADSRTGLHFGPSDPSDLAAKVQWAWFHPDQTDAMAREARAEYENNYTPEKSYQKLMEIYESVTSTRSGWRLPRGPFNDQELRHRQTTSLDL
jgi:glycosyltransferase involved in cell wall biosynthesis